MKAQGLVKPTLDRRHPFQRLPQKYKKTVREEVWDLSENSAGVSILFSSDTVNLSVKWSVKHDLSMNHMTDAGIKGIDLYTKRNNNWYYTNTCLPNGKENEQILFEDIERQYPYSKWSNQAQLMTAFCYYKTQFHDESLDALERFIALYPGSKKISYAYYLRALNYFEQIKDVERDQSMTVKSKKAFYEVINKYPDSEFVEDAYLKIDIINDRLAAKEIEIARYYQFKQQWISAINRYNKILEDYDTSVYTEEALHRLVEIYYSLGLIEEAKRYASTLGFNFPDSDWYTKSYELVKDLS